ncbi:MAG: (d)CMP kinase [Oscillospiraceae bacterium]|jgi:cytidylate kinase|nr:(d)CMP kinase [Oscillospiraceae bacterium]
MFSIAIDGPAGAGKSSVSDEIAKKLGFLHVDTGALYRAVAYFFVDNKLNISKKEIILNGIKNLKLEIKFENLMQKVFINNANVNEEIRSEVISKIASKISAFVEIRRFLLKIQRETATQNNVVMDGRDIGTEVLPNANIKIFLTASAEERAERRFKQIKKTGKNSNYTEILSSINERDHADMNRDNCPLKCPREAVIYNSTGISLEKTVEDLLEVILKVLKA